MFIQLLYQKFAGNQTDVMPEEQANTKLINLLQKEDDDLYTYYC